jgi:hypothetical protein
MAYVFGQNGFKSEIMATTTKARRPVKRVDSSSKATVAEKKKAAPKKDIAKSYNTYKTFQGRQYTGMKVGRSHKWYYDKGEWKEKKVSPDDWEFTYAVTKRRAGHAPEGSGVPVGTEYHWYIIAHQHVQKLNANDYSTSMTGMKFKVAHKRASTDKWSAGEVAQRRKTIKLLQHMIEQLQQEEEMAKK